MNLHTDRQNVELFHLLFLAHLGRKVDKSVYCLKGGCNLRFYFRSPRYSEDMDLDVSGIGVHVLRDRVNAVLSSRPFGDVLEANGLRIEHVTEHKQTDTTQRWKLGLLTGSSPAPIPTKIEFSRRRMDKDIRFDPVDPQIIRAYGLAPLMVSHYGPDAAFDQKLSALVSRTSTQARDIFDLYLLLGAGKVSEPSSRLQADDLATAKENILAMTFEVFRSQVLSYLLPDERAAYDSEAAWDGMRLTVVEALEKGAR